MRETSALCRVSEFSPRRHVQLVVSRVTSPFSCSSKVAMVRIVLLLLSLAAAKDGCEGGCEDEEVAGHTFVFKISRWLC